MHTFVNVCEFVEKKLENKHISLIDFNQKVINDQKESN